MYLWTSSAAPRPGAARAPSLGGTPLFRARDSRCCDSRRAPPSRGSCVQAGPTMNSLQPCARFPLPRRPAGWRWGAEAFVWGHRLSLMTSFSGRPADGARVPVDQQRCAAARSSTGPVSGRDAAFPRSRLALLRFTARAAKPRFMRTSWSDHEQPSAVCTFPIAPTAGRLAVGRRGKN